MKKLLMVAAAIPLLLGIMSTNADAHTVKGRCPQYTRLLQKYHMPQQFSRIMWRESHCKPGAYNGKHLDRSYGLLQINTRGYLWNGVRQLCGVTYRAQLFNPETNIRCASKMYKRYGFRPWR